VPLTLTRSILVVFVPGVVAAAPWHWLKEAASNVRKKQWKLLSRSSFYAFGALAIPTVALSRLSGSSLSIFNWRVLVSILMLGSLGGYVRQCLQHAASLWSEYVSDNKQDSVRETYAHKFTAMFEVFFSIPFLVGFYAIFTYPHVDEAYGGGKQAAVVLLPSARGKEVLQSLHITVDSNGTTGPFYVIHESENEIDITPKLPDWKAGAVIRLQKLLLDSIVTVGPQTDTDPDAKRTSAGTGG
jgi:hypothetical protein